MALQKLPSQLRLSCSSQPHSAMSYRCLLVLPELMCKRMHDIACQASSTSLRLSHGRFICSMSCYFNKLDWHLQLLSGRFQLQDHPVNMERITAGKPPANIVLLRGCGSRCASFHFKVQPTLDQYEK
jgi:hypothetical protein